MGVMIVTEGSIWKYSASQPFYTVVDPDCSSLSGAITAIGNDDATLILPPGTHVADDVTVPTNIEIISLKGATLSISDGTVFTCNGPFSAGPYQVFDDNNLTSDGVVFGTGAVNILRSAWFETGDTQALIIFNAGGIAIWIKDDNTVTYSSLTAETVSTIGTMISGATEKTTPVDADMVGLMNSGSTPANILYKLSWANIKATLKTYFDAIYIWSKLSGKPAYTVGDTGGYGNFTDAITALNTAGVACNLIVPAGEHEVTDNLTVNSVINLIVRRGADIQVATTKTLTINGQLDAGLYQIFDCQGTGAVAYNGTKYPQWWGAAADGTTDDHVAIQAAIDAGVGPIILPNNNPNTTNPGTVNGTNYYLGTTGLTIIKPDQFIMEAGTSLVYAGTDSPLVVDCHAAEIEGMVLELYDVYTTGNYCLKIVGDGVAAGTTAAVVRARISAHRFANFEAAGVFVKWCKFVENDVNILNMYCEATSFPNAPGYYFDDTNQAAGGYYQEANNIRTITVNSRVALYAPGVYFDVNQVNIGTDYGLSAFSVAIANMTIGGTDNLITIPYLVINDAGTAAQTPRAIKCKFLSTASRNVLITPATYLSGIVDDAEANSNAYPSAAGKKNYLKNPTFELWADATTPAFWTLNCTAAPNTTHYRHKVNSCAITSSGASTYMSQAIGDDLANKALTFSGWFKSPATNTDTAQFGFSDSGSSSFISIPNDGSWHFLAIPYTPGVGVTGILAMIYAGSGAADQTIYADGLFVSVGSTPVILPDYGDEPLYAAATWDPASTATGGFATVDVTCTGAAIGDPVTVGFSGAGVIAGCIFNGSVKAADTVTVTFVNHSATNPLDLGSGTVTVRVHKDR